MNERIKAQKTRECDTAQGCLCELTIAKQQGEEKKERGIWKGTKKISMYREWVGGAMGLKCRNKMALKNWQSKSTETRR